MRKVIAFTAVAVVLIAVAGRKHGGTTHAATRAASTTSRPTTTRPRATTTEPRTTTSAKGTSTKQESTSAHRTKLVAKHRPKPAQLTPVQLAALRTLALQNCLELASANNMRVIAANRTWYLQQLALASHKKKGAKALHDALVLEETSTQTLMNAQYTIDDSNCYIRYG